MGLLPFVRRNDDAYALAVGMTGVKMGDRLVHLGCENGGRLGAIAAKVGLSGQAHAVVPEEASAERARRGAASAGVLVEVAIAPPTALPIDDRGFDVAVVDETAGLVGKLGPADRAAAARELRRVLRPGGRVVFLVRAPHEGLRALLNRGPREPAMTADALAAWLTAAGFASVRTLAERDGLAFVEGFAPR
jgi:ubiquinone/menaquinone biosynthesis C-methylase UbiE